VRTPRAACAIAVVAAAVAARPAAGQEAGSPSPVRSHAPVAAPLAFRIGRSIELEGRRYASDGVQLFSAPLHWRAADWRRAAGVGLVLGGLFAADRHVNSEAQAHRDGTTDGISNFVQPMGGAGAFALSAALLADGLVKHDAGALETGRDALEASVITGLLTNLVLKPAFGRERPNVSGGRTDFEPLSKNYSFPSGDATEAFSVASVIAMRSHGWVIPTIAYTTASLVAFERIDKNVHFASDVFAGAVLGTVTGRFLVARHEREEEDEDHPAPGGSSFAVVSTGTGIAVRILF
jgi:membrane-associated phospholipid phosphatase